MAKNISEVRKHLLWSVDWELQDAAEKHKVCERRMQHSRRFVRWWAAFRIKRLKSNYLWWLGVKHALESGQVHRIVPALERLIRLYRPAYLQLTFIAPLGQAYWDMGAGPIARSVVAGDLRDAKTLRAHYMRRAA